jgi:hypothetical protein
VYQRGRNLQAGFMQGIGGLFKVSGKCILVGDVQILHVNCQPSKLYFLAYSSIISIERFRASGLATTSCKIFWSKPGFTMSGITLIWCSFAKLITLGSTEPDKTPYGLTLKVCGQTIEIWSRFLLKLSNDFCVFTM